MQLTERFHQPENFDAVADGAGWVMYAGANDWELGITGVAVTFASDEQLERIWFTVKHPHNPDASKSSQHKEAIKEHGQRAWRTWRRVATAEYRNKNNGTRSWKDAFKRALQHTDMKTYVKDWGTERTKWDDLKEAARRLVRRHLDEETPDKPVPTDEVELCGTQTPAEAEINHYEWPPVIPRSTTSFQYRFGQKVRPPSEDVTFDIPAPAEPPPALTQQTLSLESLLEAEADPTPPNTHDELDPKSEVERLLPETRIRLRGSSMLGVPGIIDYARCRWQERSKKAKQNALDIIHAWEGLPEDYYLRILNNDRVTVEPDGDNGAWITLRSVSTENAPGQ